MLRVCFRGPPTPARVVLRRSEGLLSGRRLACGDLRMPEFGHLLPSARSEADARYDRSQCGADMESRRARHISIPEAYGRPTNTLAKQVGKRKA